jgi:hypothetical protein
VVLSAILEVMLRTTLALALLLGASIVGVACAGAPPFESDYMKAKGNTDGGSTNGSNSGPNGNPTAASGGDDGGANNGDDGGSTNKGGGSNAGDDGGGIATLNGCTAADFAANDMSAQGATRTITFGPAGQVIIGNLEPDTIPPTPSQYAPHCMTIASAESVTWVGAFASFPLAPSGGTTPTPIANVTTGTTTSVAFPSAGTYGFNDPNASTVMFGAILVTP